MVPVARERRTERTTGPLAFEAQPAPPGAPGAPLAPSYGRPCAAPAAPAARTADPASPGTRRGSGGEAGWRLLNLAVDAAGAGVPAALVLHASGAPRPLLSALAAAVAWPAVRAMRRRYAAGALGGAGGGLAVPADWLLLLGALTVLRALSGDATAPATELAGLVWAPALTAVCRRVTYRRLVAAHALRRVLVVGEPCAADHAVGRLAARSGHPYVIVGVVPVGAAKLECGALVAARLGVPDPAAPREDAAAVLRAARELRAQTVLVAPGPRLSAERLRRLTWGLHDAGLPVALLPGLVDVCPRRVRPEEAAGLVMLHLAPPLRHGPQVRIKAALDRTGAALGLVVLAPLLLGLAALVKATSRGPAFHRQVRCGQHRAQFTMWKFRTMVADAEERRAGLERDGANEQDGPRFKMRRDPRVTGVGKFLRRCSLDELPQLLNVLRGEMSLVGPRPPLPDEVARYDEVALRRLLVKPGITGLWQVGGRCDLSWDEALTLDLGYVDNWSLAGDLGVMSRTLRAVVDGRGAY